MYRVNLALVGWMLLVPPAAGAQASAEPAGRPPVAAGILPSSFFLVGVAAEVTPATRQGLDDETLVGLSILHRWDWLSFGGRLMLDPVELVRDLETADSEVERYRGLLGLQARAAFRAWGVEWLYGVGVHGDVRLQDHAWFVYAVPLELGAVIWRQGSHHVQLVAGMRVLVAAELVNIFLVDPNGFDNEVALDALRSEERVRPEPFFGIVFARRID